MQQLISLYEQNYKMSATQDDLSEKEIKGKECSNLAVLLSELYNFQIISCVLLYDIIRDLLEQDITEFVVELLLKIVRSKYMPIYHMLL